MTDMTKGPILRTVVAFAVPLTLANLLQQGYLLIDGAIVGRYLGVGGLAAVGAAGPLLYMLHAVFIGLGTAFTIRLAQFKGAGRTDEIPDAARALAGFAVAWSLACTVLAVALGRPILALMGVHGQLAADSHQFLLVLCVGFVPMFGTAAVSAFLRGLGDSRTPLYVMAFGSGLNIVLAYAFVALFGFGLAGAAWSTVLSSTAAFAVAILYTRSRHPVSLAGLGNPAARAELGAAFRLGVPLASQHVLLAAGIMIYVGIIAPLGEPVLAGFTAVGRIELFTSMVFLDLSGALTAFVAQNSGAGQRLRNRAALRQVVILTVGLTAVVSVAVMVSRDGVGGMFGTDPTVRSVVADYVLITYPFFPLYTVMVVLHGFLNGLGRTTVPLICTVLSFLVVRLPLSYGFRDAYGVEGIIWAVNVGWLAGLLYTVVPIRRILAAPAPQPLPTASPG